MRKLLSAYSVLILVLITLIAIGCSKEITVDLPTAESQIVVEGSIEQGQPPIVLLTYSQGYFDPTDITSLESYFVRGANVTINNGTLTETLIEVCTDDLTEEQQVQIAELLGIDPETLSTFNVCGYTSLNPEIWGEEGKVYTLQITKDNHNLKSVTKINNVVDLDSLWFKVPNDNPEDSLGFIYGILTDPDSTGNAYRWFAKRINTYPSWAPEELVGTQKDQSFIAPLGSVFDDSFFNGLSFEFAYFRGRTPNSLKFDDNNAEAGYFKRGDTIVVRGCVIDRKAFRYIDSYENQISTQGSPFSVPFNLETNVEGGLGAFIGYGAVYDTVICQ